MWSPNHGVSLQNAVYTRYGREATAEDAEVQTRQMHRGWWRPLQQIIWFQNVQSMNQYWRPLGLLVTLDVRNAFSSARWDVILHALENRSRTPLYLLQAIYVTRAWSDTVGGWRIKESQTRSSAGLDPGFRLLKRLVRRDSPYGGCIPG